MIPASQRAGIDTDTHCQTVSKRELPSVTQARQLSRRDGREAYNAAHWLGLDDEWEHHVVVLMFHDVAVVHVGLGCRHAAGRSNLARMVVK